MTVYVDLLFGLNAVINYLLLRGSAAIGGCSAPWGRLLAAAALGGLYAAASVLPGLETLQSLVCQGLCAGLMLVTAFGWKRSTVRQGVYFLALSFALSGLVLLAAQVLEPDCVFLGGRAYYGISTPALLLLAGISYGLAAMILRGCGTHTGGDIVSVQLELEGRTAVVRALRDTGNTLRDPVTGQTVLVAGRRVLETLLPAAAQIQERDPVGMLQTLSASYPGLRFCLVPYRAVGVSAGLLPAVRCRLQKDGKRSRILVAFGTTELSEEGRFDALWGGVCT